MVASPWPIRNMVWAGNPVFPLAMRTLGKAHFTDDQVERFERAHRAVPSQASVGARLAAGVEEILADWRFGWLLIPLGVVGYFIKANFSLQELVDRIAGMVEA